MDYNKTTLFLSVVIFSCSMNAMQDNCEQDIMPWEELCATLSSNEQIKMAYEIRKANHDPNPGLDVAYSLFREATASEDPLDSYVDSDLQRYNVNTLLDSLGSVVVKKYDFDIFAQDDTFCKMKIGEKVDGSYDLVLVTHST